MKKVLLLFLIILPTVALFYFGLTRDPRTLPSTLLGKSAPDFQLETVEGKKISFSSAKGSPVVLNFWSTWCGSCLGEHQLIREAQSVYEKKGVQFYSILYEDTPQNAKEFIAQFGKAAPILLDPELRTAINYGVSGVPETFFIDRQGTIRYKFAGQLSPEMLYEQLKRLTVEPGRAAD